MKIIISGKFEKKQAKMLMIENEGAQLCDAVNFSFVNFSGNEIERVGDDKLTTYLFDKAIERGGIPPVVKSRKSKASE
jgi:hypothetical protein